MLQEEIIKALDIYVGDKEPEKKTTIFGENPYDVEIHEKDVDTEKVTAWFYLSVGR